MNFNSQSPFTIAFWFKPAVFNHISDGTHLLNIRAAEDRWPDSDWGWLWTHIQASDNKLSFNLKKKESEKHSIDLENKSENNLENKNINPKEKNTIS